MSIPRKKSRPLEVDGQKFRYMIKDAPFGPEVEPEDRETILTVQEDSENPGRVLQVALPYGFSITPEQVRGIVKQGLKTWKPSERGPAFKLEGVML